jgi:hypothetical protein
VRAQTNVQLYNQLIAEGRPIEDLRLVQGAYELSARLYSGCHQADGRPFVCHAVAVASLVASEGLPARMVAAALLHNAYGNADFGDGRQYVATPSRRARLRQALGDDLEALVHRFFREMRDGDREPIDSAAAGDADSRGLQVIEIADFLDFVTDADYLYFGDGRWVESRLEREGAAAAQRARDLGCERLAAMMDSALALQGRRRPEVEALRSPDGARHLKQYLPLSSRRRLNVRLVHAARPLWLRLRGLLATRRRLPGLEG